MWVVLAWCLFWVPGGNGRDSGIAGWENMGMGFKFQMGMVMGWEWEWSRWNGRELVRKICSRTPLVQKQSEQRTLVVRRSRHILLSNVVTVSAVENRTSPIRRKCAGVAVVAKKDYWHRFFWPYFLILVFSLLFVHQLRALDWAAGLSDSLWAHANITYRIVLHKGHYEMPK